jgi:hypothetical protein
MLLHRLHGRIVLAQRIFNVLIASIAKSTPRIQNRVGEAPAALRGS